MGHITIKVNQCCLTLTSLVDQRAKAQQGRRHGEGEDVKGPQLPLPIERRWGRGGRDHQNKFPSHRKLTLPWI